MLGVILSFISRLCFLPYIMKRFRRYTCKEQSVLNILEKKKDII